jgi:cell division protein FtsZ
MNTEMTDIQEEEAPVTLPSPFYRTSRKEPEMASEAEMTDIEARAKDRIRKLKDLSIKLRSPGGLAEIENEPAYIRRNIKLAEITPASSSFATRYTLSVDEENQGEIRTNNSFLHDNVD